MKHSIGNFLQQQAKRKKLSRKNTAVFRQKGQHFFPETSLRFLKEMPTLLFRFHGQATIFSANHEGGSVRPQR